MDGLLTNHPRPFFFKYKALEAGLLVGSQEIVEQNKTVNTRYDVFHGKSFTLQHQCCILLYKKRLKF